MSMLSLSSPRRRGFSLGRNGGHFVPAVVPAQAGVFRAAMLAVRRGGGRPRAGGGFPDAGAHQGHSADVVPAQAGVFQTPAPTRATAPMSSPRRPGFSIGRRPRRRRTCVVPAQAGVFQLAPWMPPPPKLVVPAQAGVFRELDHLEPCGPSRPRAGGGFPQSDLLQITFEASSPRRRGFSGVSV